MIHYFCKKLYSFIQIQLDHLRRDLDLWEEIVEKAVNVKAKTCLQPFFETKKINLKCAKSYKLSAKKEKNKTSQKHQDEVFNKDKDKAKSYNSFSTNN